ncbi:MAG TPA: TonB-dependent receptor, partial [Myxococcaceae bacterium]|nr:TonB-dependent receptor [Myxococcaceae bacterium]
MERSCGGWQGRPTARASGWVLGLICSSALAQGTGVITGTVQDASTLAALPDVVVTAKSPALLGEQIVLTDAAGEYHVPQLPPGMYSLRFEREDHKPFTREGIEVQPGYTLRFNAELIPETAGETTIAVVGKPPLIDVGSTQQGAVVDQDFIRNIPVAPPQGITGNGRSFESVALTVPSARADLYGVALNGTTSPENSYLIDGLSTRNPSKGISGSPLSVEFVESVAVTTGGYLPEYGRSTGGIIAANTRSGGNEFHGSVWGTWTPGVLAGSPHPVQLPASVYAFREVPHNIVDFGASLGGFLIKDRLWFFVGIQPEFTRYSEYRDLNPYKVDDITGNRVKDATGRYIIDPTLYTRRYFADEHQFQYFAKLTYLFSDDHRLALTVTGTPSHSGGENSFSFQPTQRAQARILFNGVAAPETLFVRRFDGNFDTVLKLGSSFAEKSILLDVTAGWHHEDHNVGPGDGSKLGSTDPSASVNQPRVGWDERSIIDFETLPPDVVASCQSDQHGGVNRCPASWLSG